MLFGVTQSSADAQANLDRLRQRRIAQLQPKADAGTLTAAQQKEWLQLTGQDPTDNYTAEDALDAGWSELGSSVVNEVTNLPDAVSTGAGNVTGWIGRTLGNISGGLVKGLASGFANPVTIVMGLVAVAVVVWAFTRGPLSGAKVKVIPVPV